MFVGVARAYSSKILAKSKSKTCCQKQKQTNQRRQKLAVSRNFEVNNTNQIRPELGFQALRVVMEDVEENHWIQEL